MTNYKMKLVKSAAVLALGASVITSAVVAGDLSASAKTTYKVSKGKLVNAKTKKAVKGYKVYKSVLYKDGKKFTGLYSKRYYKAGVKATGTYKGAYYVKGTKKVTTGTYNGAYYVKGVKKVTTGTYNKAYYVKGKKVVTTGLYKEKFYNKGVLNVGLTLYKNKLYKDAELNKGLEKYKDKYYFDAVLANDTYIDNGVEKAFENGVEVGAKVKSVEVINGTTIEVKFNKAVDKASATAVETSGESKVVSIAGATLTEPKLSEDGRTLTLTYTFTSATVEFKDATVEVSPVVTKADAKVSTPKFVTVLNFKDTEEPAIKDVTTKNKAGKKVDATITFNKALKSIGAVSIDGIVDPSVTLSADGKSIVIENIDAGSTKQVDITNLEDNVGNKTASISTTIVTSEDTVAPTAVFTTDGTNVKVKFSEDVKTTSATVTGNGTSLALSATPDADGFYTIDASSLLTGTQTFLKDVKFVVADVTDLAGNTTAKNLEYTTTIQKASTVAPKYVSATVATDGKTITVNYDKEVAQPTSDATFSYVYTDAEGILYKDATTQTFKALAADAKLSTDKKSVIYTVPDSVKLPNGAYTFTYGTETFTGNIAVPATVAPATATVTSTVSVTGTNEITVKYSEVMDDSAKLASNYKLAGKSLPAGTTINFVGDKQTVEIILPAGTVDKDGSRVLEISNVVAKSGNTLAPVSTPLTAALTDNVAPTTNGVAVLSTSELATVSFSEPLKALTAAVEGVTVKVNGVVLDSTKFTLAVTTDGKLAITIDPAVKLSLTDSVTVELAKTTNLTDANGNVAIVK